MLIGNHWFVVFYSVSQSQIKTQKMIRHITSRWKLCPTDIIKKHFYYEKKDLLRQREKYLGYIILNDRLWISVTEKKNISWTRNFCKLVPHSKQLSVLKKLQKCLTIFRGQPACYSSIGRDVIHICLVEAGGIKLV